MTGQVLSIFLGIFMFTSFAIACNDFLCYKIPNQLLILLVVLYIIRNLIFLNPAYVIQPGIYATITLGVGFVLYLLKVMGAGDAKLLAVTTLWMADYSMLDFYSCVALLGGLMAVIYFFAGKTIYKWRHKMLDRIKAWPARHFIHKIMVLPTASNPSQAAYQHPINELKALPYGVPIFLSTIVLIVKTALGS